MIPYFHVVPGCHDPIERHLQRSLISSDLHCHVAPGAPWLDPVPEIHEIHGRIYHQGAALSAGDSGAKSPWSQKATHPDPNLQTDHGKARFFGEQHEQNCFFFMGCWIDIFIQNMAKFHFLR